ncbi:MAG: radical SAM protein [Phycisphaerae bacterium]|nr:radical SAM protein [Phycisphaerae bacterium]
MRLNEKDYTYFTTVRGLCRRCRQIVPARVFFRQGQVWQQSLCANPACGEAPPARIAADQNGFLASTLKPMPDHSPLPGSHAPARGCPHDCGPCALHASPCQLPVLSITNACQLRCPICFTYNRADKLYHMPVEEMRRTVDWIVESSGPVDLINITGGEPTLHPQILDILDCCRRPEIGRVTMNSNGLRLAEDKSLCQALAERNVYVILSFNTLDSAVSERLHGRDLVAVKRQAIDNLTAAGVRMTLLTVLIRDVNEDALGGIWSLMRQNDNVLSLTVQTMTYTGQGGGSFPNTGHIPVDEAARIVCEQTGGELTFTDFVTRPSTHPLCYLVSYALKAGPSNSAGTNILPFARIASPDRLADLIRDSYLVRPEEGQEFFADMINPLYAQGNSEHLATLRELVERLYPVGKSLSAFERQRIAESAVRTVYIHAHMDEETFDCSRAMMCPDLVPAGPGRLIPACTYNLFNRMQDERFYVE